MSASATTPVFPAGAYDRQAARCEVEELNTRVGVEPETCLGRARALGAVAAEAGDEDVGIHARVLEADSLLRMGQVADAARILTAVREGHHHQSAEHRVRTGLVLMRICLCVGDSAAGLDHALEAARWIGEDIPSQLYVEFFIKYGDVMATVGDLDAAREHYARAEELAVGDHTWHLRVVNNRAFTALQQGNTEQAVAAAARMVELAAHYGHPLNCDELDTLAHIYLRQQRPDLAVAAAQEALAVLASGGRTDSDYLPDLLLTLATAQRCVGDLAAAADCLQRARAIASTQGFHALSARSFEEEAEVLAVRGDFRGAFEAHKAFHRADKELVSLGREAQSRVRQAMYELTQVRADAARFREEARQDPLTGLCNRLGLGERLSDILDARVRGGPPVVAAMFDLDHFKSVNDDFSHEVGDRVLMTFAEILIGALGSENSGLAARLGGEEFLLVLAADSTEQAVGIIHGVRQAVEEHDWSAMTPGRAITVSAGVAFVDDDTTYSSLLRNADVELYAAKTAGRNRVSGDA